jgi:hypothetical protein
MSLDAIRFYNGQSGPFQQKFFYTKPDTDFREENGGAYYSVDASPKSFFAVPFELESGTGGIWRISVHKEITERFGRRGLIRVDANSKLSLIADLKRETIETLQAKAEEAIRNESGDIARITTDYREKIAALLKEKKSDDDYHLALSHALAEYLILAATDNSFAYTAFDDASAKKKGDLVWRKYLRQVIEDFEFENMRRVTEWGVTPLRPKDYVKHAYSELGMEVPGDEKFVKAGVQQTEVSELKQTVLQQQKQIEQLLQLHEKGKAATAPTDAAGEPETVGAGTEKGKKK